jgi:alpha-galactosidase
MSINMANKAKAATLFAAWIAVMMMGMTLTGCKSQPKLTGKWLATGKTLANGEVEKTIFDLKEDGNHIGGEARELDWKSGVKGTFNGNHLELFDVGSNDKKPFLVAELVNGKLEGKIGDDRFTARPATDADEFPKFAYIEPPTLHSVPSNGLALTPPMGWNSWNLFAEKVDDQTVRTIADAMVSSGMKDAGYIYVNIDDTWEEVRDANGVLGTNQKFPDMKSLADYVHSKGLKIGIYTSPGPRTCGGYPASYGYEEQDAKMFAAWGIDYLKYDWCSASLMYKDDQLRPVYQKMGDALHAAGRPIVFSLCEYGLGGVEKWGPAVGGNLWRTTDDISDDWDSMMGNIHKQVPTAPYAGPGHWNDPDMLEVGNGHMTDNEYRTHMSLWALTAAPLLAGNDIRKMSDSTRSILLNKEVIAIDQDRLGKQASPVTHGNIETWVKPLKDGGVALGVVNLDRAPGTAQVKASDLRFKHAVRSARDLWAHKDVKFTNGEYSVIVAAHGILLLRIPAQ